MSAKNEAIVDDIAFRDLGNLLGTLCGALDRPGVRVLLIEALRLPQGEYTRDRLTWTHQALGQVLDAARTPQPGDVH